MKQILDIIHTISNSNVEMGHTKSNFNHILDERSLSMFKCILEYRLQIKKSKRMTNEFDPIVMQ